MSLKRTAYRWINIFVVLFLIGVLSNQSWAVPSEGHRMMMSGPSPYATEVAKKIILKGGNVVDVAVAIGLTLSVTTPYFAALGGGGFAMVKMGGKPVEVLDFRETAPLKTHPKYYLDKAKDASVNGPFAVGTPGFPAGLWSLHKKYGKIHWSQLFDEPIRLATKGFRVSGEWSNRTQSVKSKFNRAGIKHLFKKDGSKYLPGELLKQKPLGRALKMMRNRGIVPFYRGVIARDLVETIKSLGGDLSLTDLYNYKVRWLKPMTTLFKGHQIYLMPPPSSGGVVLKQALGIVEQLNMEKYPTFSADEFHLLGEVLKSSFRGRYLLGDPQFHKNPLELLTGSENIKELSKNISVDGVVELEPLKIQVDKAGHQTTHFSVLDYLGNAVSLTVTLNTVYGSKVVTNKYGIALNNEMDDFTTKPGVPNSFGLIQGKGNQVQPGKRPLSSMSPTLVEKDGKIVMAVGAQGGSRIISGVFQTLYRSIVSGMNMERSIEAPRVHHQFLPNVLAFESEKFSPEIIKAVEKRGHKVRPGRWKSKVYGVKFNKQGLLEAAADSRNEGSSGGI